MIEALSFGLARIKPKPVSFSLQGIRFNDVDRVLWGVIADVFINRVYLPTKFLIRENDVVVDIGAHRGSFTSFAAVHTRANVIAFEPHPDNFMYLKRLITDNNLLNVNAYNVAIGAETGKARLFLSNASSRHSIFGHEAGTTRELKESIEIRTLSLNDCLKDMDHVDLVKMDCEGAEVDILLNASDKTMTKIKKLAVEIHKSIDSEEVKLLQERLSRCYPHIKLVQQSHQQYGYLYAHH